MAKLEDLQNRGELVDNRYRLIRLIGRGAFSDVWEVEDMMTHVIHALKYYAPSGETDENGVDMLIHEFALLADANHTNLLCPLHFATHEGCPYLTLRLCRRGNVNRFIGKFTEPEAWRLLHDAASALAYLHNMNPPIIHQDIKPANILIGDDGGYMLTDFGVSTKVRSSLSKTNGTESLNSAGTLAYMAPEKFSENNMPIMANDIYSLGVTLFELLTGYLPFGNEGGLLLKKGADIPVVSGDYSQQLKDIVRSCMAKEAWNRPTAQQLEAFASEKLHSQSTSIQQPLSYTVVSPQDEPQQITQEDHQLRTSNNHRKPQIVAVLSIVLLAGGAALLFWPKKQSSTQTTAIITPEAARPPIDTLATQSVKKVIPQKDTSNKQPTTVVPPVKVQPQQEIKERTTYVPQKKPTAKGLDLGYAIWTGPSANGLPIEGEFGTLTFKQDYALGNGHTAHKGDRIEDCQFHNGRFYQGIWVQANGERTPITP